MCGHLLDRQGTRTRAHARQHKHTLTNSLSHAQYNVLRLYKKPAHTNEDVANVATVYVAPLSLLLHLGLASYFYTVVVECPDEIICDPSRELTVTYALMASAAGILLLVSVLYKP